MSRPRLIRNRAISPPNLHTEPDAPLYTSIFGPFYILEKLNVKKIIGSLIMFDFNKSSKNNMTRLQEASRGQYDPHYLHGNLGRVCRWTTTSFIAWITSGWKMQLQRQTRDRTKHTHTHTLAIVGIKCHCGTLTWPLNILLRKAQTKISW